MSDFEGPDIFTKSHEVCSENISSEVSLAELATFTYIYKAKLLTVSTDGVESYSKYTSLQLHNIWFGQCE